MEKYFLTGVMSIILFSQKISAQVGINTNTPQGTLEVMGSTLVESYLIDNTNSVATGDYLLVVRSLDTTPVGEVKLLDVSLRDVAPVNKYQLVLQDVNQDQVTNLDTGLKSSKYVVGVTGAVFTVAEPTIVGTAGANQRYGAYSKNVKVLGNGNYGLDLDFVGAGTASNNNGTWTVDLLVFERALLRDFGTLNASISTDNTGSSNNTPIGLQ